jgi:hypothetical protein
MVSKKVFIMCAAMVVSGCTDSEAVKTCRADLERSLKSPSSLKIIDTYAYTEETEVLAARTEYILPKLLREEKLTDNKTRVVAIQKVMITYDADNSYGAALRDTHHCALVAAEFGLTVVEHNIEKDPTIYQLTSDEMMEAADKAVEAADKAMEAATKAMN